MGQRAGWAPTCVETSHIHHACLTPPLSLPSLSSRLRNSLTAKNTNIVKQFAFSYSNTIKSVPHFSVGIILEAIYHSNEEKIQDYVAGTDSKSLFITRISAELPSDTTGELLTKKIKKINGVMKLHRLIHPPLPLPLGSGITK